MGRSWRPLLVGGTIAVGTFVLAQAQVFAPSAPAEAAAGDVYRGETIFQRECASCHGEQGRSGGVGPALAGSGLDVDDVSAAVQQGRGVMPAAIVIGSEQSDVVAYVASISGASE